MVESALIGEPPANTFDYNVVKWYINFVGQTSPALAAKLEPSMGIPTVTIKPPNYHFESRQDLLLGLGWATFALIILYTIGRIIVPIKYKSVRWGWDDTIYIMAALGGLAVVAVQLTNTYVGKQGNHLWDLTYYEFDMQERYNVIFLYIYRIPLVLIKIALALFVLRVVGNSSRKWSWAMYIYMFLNAVYLLLTFILPFALCPPYSSFLNVAKSGAEDQELHTTKNVILYDAITIVNCVLDFILVFVPVVLFFRVNLKRARKIRLMLLFVIGAGTCVTSAVLVSIGAKIRDKADTSWYTAQLFVVCYVEMILSFTVANAAMFNMLFNVLILKHIETASRRTSYSSWQSPNSSQEEKPKAKHIFTPAGRHSLLSGRRGVQPLGSEGSQSQNDHSHDDLAHQNAVAEYGFKNDLNQQSGNTNISHGNRRPDIYPTISPNGTVQNIPKRHKEVDNMF